MKKSRFSSSLFGIILITLIVGLVLNLVPYFEWMKYARPDWVLLVLFYWCLAAPDRVGVGCGWAVGLVMDILNYSLLGQHAIGKAFVALVAVVTNRRIRLYELWQQCIIVFFIASIDIGLTLWAANITEDIEVRLVYWQSALTTALAWPVVYNVLRFLRHRTGVNG